MRIYISEACSSAFKVGISYSRKFTLDYSKGYPIGNLNFYHQQIDVQTDRIRNMMSTSHLTKAQCQQIDAVCRDFWWGYGPGNHHCYVRAWDKFKLPYKLGGLQQICSVLLISFTT